MKATKRVVEDAFNKIQKGHRIASACDLCKTEKLMGMAVPACSSEPCRIIHLMYYLAQQGYDCDVLPAVNDTDSTLVSLAGTYPCRDGYKYEWVVLYRNDMDINLINGFRKPIDLDYPSTIAMPIKDFCEKRHSINKEKF